MKKQIKGVCVVLLTVSSMGIWAFSQVSSSNAGMTQARKVDTATRSNFLAKAGGFIKLPAKGDSVRIINAQTRVSADTINEVANSMRQTFRYSIVVATSKDSKEGSAWVEESLKQKDTAAVLVIIDAASQPPLIVAPEARWAIMNVAALSKIGTEANILEERTKKQLWRAYGYLMGCAHSDTDQCVMRPVFKAEDLDGLKFSTLGLESIVKIQKQTTVYGITPERMSTYRKACEDGWAPMPTNSFQKVIWEEARAKKAVDKK
jgi:hypothetical protein